MFFSKVSTHYVSEKVAKVRWVPEQLQQSDRFLTGSWDMNANFVRLWHMYPSEYPSQNVEQSPRCNDKVAMQGDITGMEFVDNNLVAVSCSDGHLSLLKVQRAVEEDQLRSEVRSERLHYFEFSQKSAPCTGISVYGNDIATIGEDGRLNVLNASNLKQVKRTIEADSMALFAVTYASQQEIFTANRMGVVRMFDPRVPSGAQQSIAFMSARQDEKSSNFVSCMITHPMQSHILLCASEEGSITVWDTRQLEYPASYLSAHSSPITDISFHSMDPTKLFTAAEAGEVWLWSENKMLIDAGQEEGYSPWLSGDRMRTLIDINGVLSNMRKSINSFDVQGTSLVCGSDTEAIYIVDNFI